MAEPIDFRTQMALQAAVGPQAEVTDQNRANLLRKLALQNVQRESMLANARQAVEERKRMQQLEADANDLKAQGRLLETFSPERGTERFVRDATGKIVGRSTTKPTTSPLLTEAQRTEMNKTGMAPYAGFSEQRGIEFRNQLEAAQKAEEAYRQQQNANQMRQIEKSTLDMIAPELRQLGPVKDTSYQGFTSDLLRGQGMFAPVEAPAPAPRPDYYGPMAADYEEKNFAPRGSPIQQAMRAEEAQRLKERAGAITDRKTRLQDEVNLVEKQLAEGKLKGVSKDYLQSLADKYAEAMAELTLLTKTKDQFLSEVEPEYRGDFGMYPKGIIPKLKFFGQNVVNPITDAFRNIYRGAEELVTGQPSETPESAEYFRNVLKNYYLRKQGL